jgi:predicted Fe-S protein YdhL (DUF1289 family)
MIESPCVKICTLAATPAHSERLCTGCYRTVSEIAGWRQFSAETRRAVLRELPRRREVLLAAARPPADD